MPVIMTEALNSAEMSPQLLRTLLAILPNVKLLTISPTIINAGLAPEQTFALSGVAVGDFVYAIKPTAQAGLGIAGSRVSAANTVGITFVNPTAGNITPTASETYLILHCPGLLTGRSNILP